MLVSTNIAGNIRLTNMPGNIDETCCTEIDDKTFSEVVSSGISFVLLYKEDSGLCNRLEYNINEFSKIKNNRQIQFYKLDIEKYPIQYNKYNISGTPTILIYKNGMELDRIMGIIPVSNLEMIYNRVIK